MKSWLTILVVAVLACAAHANILRVSQDGTGDYTTISAAVSAATTDGDTLVIRGDGVTYTESLTLPRPLVLVGAGIGCEYDAGSATWTHLVAPTSIAGSITFNSSACSGSIIEGLVIATSQNVCTIHTGNTGVTFRRCRLYTNGSSGNGYSIVSVEGTSTVSIEDCVLLYNDTHNSSGAGVYIASSAVAYLTNTVISLIGSTNPGGAVGIYIASSSASAFVSNCAVLGAFANSAYPYGAGGNGNWAVDNTVFYSVNAATTISGSVSVSYNAYPSTMTSWPTGTGDVSLTSSPFINYTSGLLQICTDATPSNLHLATGSPLIDAGDPGLPNDLDATTRDIGIYGGEEPMVDTGAPDFPFVTSLMVGTSVPQNGILEIRATGRVGRGE
jgi:hypothetical protein